MNLGIQPVQPESAGRTVGSPVAAFQNGSQRHWHAAAPLSVKLVTDVDELRDLVPQWEELSAQTLDPNVFYEHWMLLPGIEHFGEGKDLRFVLIFEEARSPLGRRLCGLFPFERLPKYRGLPIPVYSLWQHSYCFFGTPLIRAYCARECLAALFDWFESRPDSPAFIEFKNVSGEGPFDHALTDILNKHERSAWVDERFNRAFFRPGTGGDAYLEEALSPRARKKLRQQRRALSEQGYLEFRSIDSEEKKDAWVDRFLELEAQGWKGRNGTAMVQREHDREFFKTIASNALRLGRLKMIAMHLNGHPIAQKCDFASHDGRFAFKIAFDERYSHFSPGVLLEVENIRRLHETGDVQWADSCAVPDHFMINRLWRQRRTIQTLLVSTGRAPANLLVSTFPLIRWAGRKLRRLSSRRRRSEVDG